jgi:soluble lytic murein transglycosylase-like protein
MKRLIHLGAIAFLCAFITFTGQTNQAHAASSKAKSSVAKTQKSDAFVEFVKKRLEAKAKRAAKAKILKKKHIKKVSAKKSVRSKNKKPSLLARIFKGESKTRVDPRKGKKSSAKKRNQSSKKRYYKAKGGSKRYHSIIARHARANGVPLNLAKAVIRIESNFNPNARGGVGEIGLMQLRYNTARGVGYRGSKRALYNPETNIRYGMKYLGQARKLAGGSLCGTILKYNAGHGAKRMNPISANYCRKVKRVLAHY